MRRSGWHADLPSSSLSAPLQLRVHEGAVQLRSLKWPGYFFVHETESPLWGGAYFGAGQENKDLCFML